jgi:hypothetical protein
MKLFEIEERVNGAIRLSYVNPEYIIDILHNYNINKEPFGSKVRVQGGMVTTYYDIRTPEEIAKILKAL